MMPICAKDRERENQLRREADQTWEHRCREEQRQREDDEAQQTVIVEFPPGGPLSQAQQATTKETASPTAS